MVESSIYKTIIETKNNSIIPVLLNGKTIESRYNPQNEAIRKIEQINSEYKFFVIIGICSGILIEELIKKIPEAKIICVENSKTDIDFLCSIPKIQDLQKNPNIIFSTSEELYENLVNNYIPSFYGNLKVIEHNVWGTENPINYEKIKKIIELALSDISKDFSVQAHFGKIWNFNIIKNAKLVNNNKAFINKPDNSKTAVVVAAGPSLDHSIHMLQENREKYYVIATDTAFSTLLKNNILSDCVVSIDGQCISYNHFIHDISKFSNTLFVFDLTANSSTAEFLINNNIPVVFSVNSHPLSQYLNYLNKHCFIDLFTGSGTVTIGAIDFAVKNGFKEIRVLGADFSYINGKAYAKGTYLETLYNSSSTKLFTDENQFEKLMFRTQLIQINKDKSTTDVLKSYETSLNLYLEQNKLIFKKIDDIYFIENQNGKCFYAYPMKQECDLEQLKAEVYEDYKNLTNISNIKELKNTSFCLLPLISWLRNNDDIKEGDFNFYLEKAYSIFTRYLN